MHLCYLLIGVLKQRIKLLSVLGLFKTDEIYSLVGCFLSGICSSYMIVMVWEVEGQDTGSGVSKMETTAGVRQQAGFILSLIHISEPTRPP